MQTQLGTDLEWFCLFRWLRRVPTRLRLFCRYPVLDVRRTISEFDAVGFAECEKLHSIAVGQIDLLEVQRDDTSFTLDRSAQDVQVFSREAPAYAQDNMALFNQHAVDSAGHALAVAVKF